MYTSKLPWGVSQCGGIFFDYWMFPQFGRRGGGVETSFIKLSDCYQQLIDMVRSYAFYVTNGPP